MAMYEKATISPSARRARAAARTGSPSDNANRLATRSEAPLTSTQRYSIDGA